MEQNLARQEAHEELVLRRTLENVDLRGNFATVDLIRELKQDEATVDLGVFRAEFVEQVRHDGELIRNLGEDIEPHG